MTVGATATVRKCRDATTADVLTDITERDVIVSSLQCNVLTQYTMKIAYSSE